MNKATNILVSSNDEKCRDLIALFLSDDERYSVKTTQDYHDTLLAILDSEIDLLIMDLDSEGTSGLKTLKLARKTRPKIPVIAVSSKQIFLQTGGMVKQSGVHYFLVKPFEKNELEEAAHSALEKRELRTADELSFSSSARMEGQF